MPKFLMLIAVLAMAALTTGCGWSKPEPGQIGLIRNGGPLDNRQIRDVIPENSGNKWIGMMSETRYYPAASSQRTYKFDDAKDADAKPREVFTKDGVRVRLTGTFYLKTAFDNSPQGVRLLKAFDTAFSNRPEGQRPWEDWSGWLNATAQPIIDSNLRTIIAEFDCQQLVSSCALVQNQRGGGQRSSDVKNVDNRKNVQVIAERLSTGLQSQLDATLGNPYFREIRFELGLPELPGVQEAIDKAQAAFAQVTEAEAREDAARADSRANVERQKGYSRCPACARIDAIKALPRELTALGGDFAVPIK